MRKSFNFFRRIKLQILIHFPIMLKNEKIEVSIRFNSIQFIYSNFDQKYEAHHIPLIFSGALLGICGTAFSFYNRHDLLSDINKEFVVIRQDTKSINEQVQLLANEQRDFLRVQQQRDREVLEREARFNVTASKSQRANSQSDESWVHWIARKTYVISIYRYFVPNTVN